MDVACCRWGWHGRPVSIRRTLLYAITIHCYPIDEKVETNINKQYKQFGWLPGSWRVIMLACKGYCWTKTRICVVTIPLPMRAPGWWRDAPDARDGPRAIRSVEVCGTNSKYHPIQPSRMSRPAVAILAQASNNSGLSSS